MSPIVLTAAFEDAALVITAFGAFVLVPVVLLLTYHQRKMAEIIHRGHGAREEEIVGRLEAVQRELADLRQRQNETILALEERRGPDVRERVAE